MIIGIGIGIVFTILFILLCSIITAIGKHSLEIENLKKQNIRLAEKMCTCSKLCEELADSNEQTKKEILNELNNGVN